MTADSAPHPVGDRLPPENVLDELNRIFGVDWAKGHGFTVQSIMRYRDALADALRERNDWKDAALHLRGNWGADVEQKDAAFAVLQLRVEVGELVKTVFGWIVEDHPVLVHGYVMGHHMLDPIVDLPMFFRAFPTVDLESWMAKHAEAMDKLAALAAEPKP